MIEFKKKIVAVARVLPTWSERTIVWRLSCGMVLAKHGWLYGTLMVHSGFSHDLTSVTHLPSKVEVARMPDEATARELVEQLWEACRPAWVGAEVDKASIPAEYVELLTSFTKGN